MSCACPLASCSRGRPAVLFHKSYAGWHDLLVQVSGGVDSGTLKYYIDGVLVASHPAKYYPETPMSINFNLWFINGGLQGASPSRTDTQLVDYVYYAGGEVLDQATVSSRVASDRAAGTRWVDTVTGP